MSIFLTKQKIIKDWTDYNGHMNVAYYVLIFDQFGSEVLLTKFDMGEHSAKTTKKSTMVVESHITYDQEVKEGDEVDINLIYCDHDKKRIQYKLEMIHSEKKYLAATLEALSLIGVFKYKQIPNLATTIGLVLIVIGVIIVNTMNDA